MPQTPSTQARPPSKIIPDQARSTHLAFGDQSIPDHIGAGPMGRPDSTDNSRIRVAKQWSSQPAARPKVIASAPARCKLRTLPVGQHPRLSGQGNVSATPLNAVVACDRAAGVSEGSGGVRRDTEPALAATRPAPPTL